MITKFELERDINAYKKWIEQLQNEISQETDESLLKVKIEEMRRLSERVVILQKEYQSRDN